MPKHFFSPARSAASKRIGLSASSNGASPPARRIAGPRPYGQEGRTMSHPAAQAQRLGAAVPLPEGIEWTTFLRQYRYRLPAWVYWYGL